MAQPDPDLPAPPEGDHPAVRGVALLVRFGLELTLFGAASWSAYTAATGHWWQWPLAALAPVAVIAAWGRWLSPRARHRPAEPAPVLIEAVLFGVVGSMLWALGHPVLGAALAGAWLVDRVVLAAVRR
jgi:hypothetical protein